MRRLKETFRFNRFLLPHSRICIILILFDIKYVLYENEMTKARSVIWIGLKLKIM